MRVTYRSKDSKSYWRERWENIPADDPAENLDSYPLKYADMTIAHDDGRILEMGCGAGRVLRFYKNKGRFIVGMDYIGGALEKLVKIDGELLLNVCDARNSCYRDGCFRYALAFGLYHNMPLGEFGAALEETCRILEPGGKLCASFRADNIHNYLIDRKKEIEARRRAGKNGEDFRLDSFHKLNLKRSELVERFERAGFIVEKVMTVENMPLLYHFPVFRASAQKRFNESLGRREGYRLSLTGKIIQKTLFALFPKSFCNIFVVIAGKPEAINSGVSET